MRAFLLACVALVCLPAFGSAQELPPEMRTGNHLLRHLVGKLELTPVTSFADLGDDPSDVVLIVLGDPRWLADQPPDFLPDFVKRGGSLLLATDHDMGRGQALGQLVVLSAAWIEEVPLLCGREQNCYDGNPELPLLEAAALNEGGPSLMYSLFDVRRVAVSRPSHLRKWPGLAGVGAFPIGQIRPIAYLPVGTLPERDYERLAPMGFTLDASSRLFGIGGPHGKGRLVLLADQHLFMNDLMIREDLQNFEFADATLRYLHEKADGGKRTRCLFLENGQVQDSFKANFPDLSEFPIDALRREARKLEAALGVMEERGEFHKAFWNLMAQKEITPARLAAIVAVVLTLLAGIYLLYRLILTRAPVEHALPRLTRSVEKQVPTARLATQRRHEQIEYGRLHEPARHLARKLFGELGLPPSPTPPVVAIAGGWWQRRAVLARFQRLWKLAFAESPVPVSARQWPAFLRDLESLREGFLDGSIHLESVPVA